MDIAMERSQQQQSPAQGGVIPVQAGIPRLPKQFLLPSGEKVRMVKTFDTLTLAVSLKGEGMQVVQDAGGLLR